MFFYKFFLKNGPPINNIYDIVNIIWNATAQYTSMFLDYVHVAVWCQSISTGGLSR